MTSETKATLYGLDKPDEQTDLKLKDASSKEIIKATYDAWLSVKRHFKEEDAKLSKENRSKIDWEQRDNALYNDACRILAHYKDKFTGAITQEDLDYVVQKCRERMLKDHFGSQWREGSYLGDGWYSHWSTEVRTEGISWNDGLYLSALLNTTDAEMLSLGDVGATLSNLGYRLTEGKTLIIGKDCRISTLGGMTKGGTIINRGRVSAWMGLHATGGLHINLGKIGCRGMSESASGGFHINLGKCGGMARNAFGGLHINLGKFRVNTDEVGDDAHNCALVGVKNSHYSDFVYNNYTVSKSDLSSYMMNKDDILLGFLDEIKRECRHPTFWEDREIDTQKVTEIARKVDSHVRENYKPRRFRKGK